MKYASIQNDQVVNIIELEPENFQDYAAAVPFTVVSLESVEVCDIGYTASYTNGVWNFSEPENI